jgi:aspartate racemase
MRYVQPEGPYFLVGLCMGGTVAYEMGQQLHAQGQKVALLTLVESFRPYRTTFFRYIGHCFQRELKNRIIKRYSHHLRNLKLLSYDEWPAYIWIKLRVAKSAILTAFIRTLTFSQPESLPTHQTRVAKLNMKAAREYEPRPYPGRITLFLATESAADIVDDTRLAWRELAIGGAEVYMFPGAHTDMFWEPQVQVLAEQLKACMDKALANNAS